MERRKQISTSAFGIGRYVFSLLHKTSYRPHGCAIIAYWWPLWEFSILWNTIMGWVIIFLFFLEWCRFVVMWLAEVLVWCTPQWCWCWCTLNSSMHFNYGLTCCHGYKWGSQDWLERNLVLWTVCSNMVRSGQVRSGQVRSECLMCTFRASCCSARLSRFHCPGQVCELQEMVYMQHL